MFSCKRLYNLEGQTVYYKHGRTRKKNPERQATAWRELKTLGSQKILYGPFSIGNQNGPPGGGTKTPQKKGPKTAAGKIRKNPGGKTPLGKNQKEGSTLWGKTPPGGKKLLCHYREETPPHEKKTHLLWTPGERAPKSAPKKNTPGGRFFL